MMRLIFPLLSGAIAGGFVLALRYIHVLRAQLSAASTARDTWEQKYEAERREAALGDARATEYRAHSLEWRSQAVDMSRRNHELTAKNTELVTIVASLKRQEFPDPTEEIEQPMSVAEADAAVAESRRGFATADKGVRPLPDGPINNDEEDDIN